MIDQQTALASVSLCLLVALRSGFLGQIGILTVVVVFVFFFAFGNSQAISSSYVANTANINTKGKAWGGGVEIMSVSALNSFQNVQSY